MRTTDFTPSAEGNGPAKAGTPSSGTAPHGVPASGGTHRRRVIVWAARLLIGGVLGFGLRVAWERKPAVRFATGLALHSLRGPAEDEEARPSHLQAGVPVRFSLDEITSASEPAVALRAWREAFATASAGDRQHCLTVPVEASLTSLRRCLAQLAGQPALREEFGRLRELLTESVPNGYDPELLRRSFAELARMDATLALDGAEASGDEGVKRAVWSIIAEDDPRKVLDLIDTRQAPAEVRHLAIASLAARSPEAADAVLRKLPEEAQGAAFEPLAQALAAGDPIKALGLSLDAEDHPDPEWVKLLAHYMPATKAVDFLLAIERDHPELIRSCDDALMGVASEQAQRDPEFALSWFQRCATPGRSMTSNASELLMKVSLHHPRKAADALAAWPRGVTTNLFGRIAAAWMRTDPVQALEWMSQQGDGADLQYASLPWRLGKPEDAAVIVGWFTRQGKLVPGNATADLAGKWAAADPAAAAAWAQNLADPVQRDLALGAALARWMTVDPAAAETRLREQVAENPAAVLVALDRFDTPSFPVFDRLLVENLPSFMRLSGGHTLEGALLESCVARAAVQRDTREEVFAIITQLPDPASQQHILSNIAKRSPNDLSLVHRVTAMMTDQAEATRLMEDSVRRAFR